MTNNKNNSTGPQGTQVFDVNDINKMIAEEIANSQSSEADAPALVGLSNALHGQQYLLNKSKLEVGRRPNSDIVLNESSVSAMHAQIIQVADGWKVLNLLSSNGTFVNGEKVTEKVIQIGDRISFAEAEFVYVMVDNANSESEPNRNTSLVIVASVLVAAFAGLFYFVI